MSLEIKGQSCPICKAYLFDDDEIAVCPTCGAPHHRECFVNAGKCGLEEFHGTDKQYDKLKENEAEEPKDAEETETAENAGKKRCFSCGSYYDEGDNFCPQCGSQKHSGGFGGFGNGYEFKFDFLGGVNPNEDLGEGHKADEVKKFVAVSTQQMIPKFKAFKGGKKVSFSFWHLLFPTATFAMRKMHVYAAFSGAIEIAASLLTMPFLVNFMSYVGDNGGAGYFNVIKDMLSQGGADVKKNLILFAVGMGIGWLWKIVCSMFANRFYYKHVIKTMSEIKEKAEDEGQKLEMYRKRGAINLFAFLLVVMFLNMVPELIYGFIN